MWGQPLAQQQLSSQLPILKFDLQTSLNFHTYAVNKNTNKMKPYSKTTFQVFILKNFTGPGSKFMKRIYNKILATGKNILKKISILQKETNILSNS